MPTSGHVHHWLIETPCGKELLQGECLRCGATRDNFRAATEDNRFEDFRPVDPLRLMVVRPQEGYALER